MSLKSGSLRIACLLVGLGIASTSQAQQYYSITGGGGQAQIGDGLPLPAQDQITPMGGKNGTMSGPIGTYTNFPDMLLIPINTNKSKALIKQTPPAGTTKVAGSPYRMKVPPGVFRRFPRTPPTSMGAPAPLVIGVAVNNPNVLQVRTTLSFSGPGRVVTNTMGMSGGTMSFHGNARTMDVSSFVGAGAGSSAIYRAKASKRFGGPSQTWIKNLGDVGVWADLPSIVIPCQHTKLGGAATPNNVKCQCLKLAAHPMSNTLAAGGGPAGVQVKTPGTPLPMPGSVLLWITNGTGLIKQSAELGMTGMLNNKATSIGFPWTTGGIELSQPAALGGKEHFHITGMDSRVAGVGTISLVASSLSQRGTTGPNSNRAWARYTLPEPGAALGTAAALGVLAICHALVRRRR